MMPGVHAPEHRPAPEKSGGRREHLAQEDVDAAGRGYADDSSAQMLAPNQVSAPATIQTSSMPPKVGTAWLTSDGWTKIDEPTMVPTTIAVACVSPIVRVSLADTATHRLRPSTLGRQIERLTSVVARRLQSAAGSRILITGCRGPAVDRPNGRDGVGLGGGLVGPIPLDAREAERDAAGILRARLHVVERDLDDDLRAHVDGVVVAADLELEELLRLPREHLVGQPLERLAEHDEAAALGVARAEVQVAERPAPAPAAPLRREHDEIERARLLHLQPRLPAAAGGVERRRPPSPSRPRARRRARARANAAAASAIRRHQPRHEVRRRRPAPPSSATRRVSGSSTSGSPSR